MSGLEIRSLMLFGIILLFWATDKFHGISPTAVSFVGAIVALLPRVGIVKWNDVDIPWHLLLFSAGAYTLGEAFKVTDLPSTMVAAQEAPVSMFDSFNISAVDKNDELFSSVPSILN